MVLSFSIFIDFHWKCMCGVKSSQAGLLSSSYLGIVSPIYLAVILCCNKIPLYAKQLFYSSLYHLVMPILVPYPCGILPIMCLKLIHYINFWALLRYALCSTWQSPPFVLWRLLVTSLLSWRSSVCGLQLSVDSLPAKDRHLPKPLLMDILEKNVVIVSL